MAARLGTDITDVHAAAVAVVKRGSTLTVAAVAEELGCQPPSVYHHIPDGLFGLQEIVNAYCKQRIREHLHGYVEKTPVNMVWAMQDWAKLNPWLYRFYRDEVEHLWDVTQRVPKRYRPLLYALDHDHMPELLREIFDAD